MDVEIAVPHAPAALAPGTETRVPVELRNASGAPVSLRVSVARSRLSDWAIVEPATADLPPGGHQTVEVVFQAPADTIVEATIPFTVRVTDALTESKLGAATGLVHVSARGRIDATLTVEAGATAIGRFALQVRNQGTKAVTLGLVSRLEPADGRAEVEPAILDIQPGRAGTARVTAHPRRRLLGRPAPYSLTLVGRDMSGGGDGRQVVEVRADGTAPPRAGVAAVVTVIVIVLAAASLIAWLGPRGLPFRGGAEATASATTAATAVAVRRPYVMVDSYPQLGPSDRQAAEASLARLTAAGLPVRLVDSKKSDDIADGTAGFWVVLRDGFGSAAEADGFCARYRNVTPRCEVVP